MPMHAGQSAPLRGRFHEMLKRAERHQDQREGPAQIERAHVALHERQALGDGRRHAGRFLPNVLQHRWRQIKTCDVVTRLGQCHCHAGGANAEFKHVAAEATGAFAIELDVTRGRCAGDEES
jgi:hypothetical protein